MDFYKAITIVVGLRFTNGLDALLLSYIDAITMASDYAGFGTVR